MQKIRRSVVFVIMFWKLWMCANTIAKYLWHEKIAFDELFLWQNLAATKCFIAGLHNRWNTLYENYVFFW